MGSRRRKVKALLKPITLIGGGIPSHIQSKVFSLFFASLYHLIYTSLNMKHQKKLLIDILKDKDANEADRIDAAHALEDFGRSGNG